MPCAIIDDGYTLTKTLEATPFYPAVRFRFRPMLAVQQRKFNLRIEQAERGTKGEISEAGIEKAEKIAAEVITKQIAEWDLRDADGKEIPVDAASFQRLESHLQGAIVATVLGNLPPDGEPEPPEGKTREEAALGN